MVTKFTHNRLFPSYPYPGPTEFDAGTPEPPVLQLAPEGILASLERMAKTLLAPYADELANLLRVAHHAKPPTLDWERHPAGWSVLGQTTTIPYPPVKVGVLDCETLVKVKEYPVMAVMLGSDGVWYSWKTPKVGEYIPLTPKSLIVGHNVSYDAALVQVGAKVLALDTQVLATQVSGLCTDQQWVSYAPPSPADKPLWAYKGYGKGNYKSLKDTAKFYLGEDLDKTIRNLFVEANSYEDLHHEWASLLSYCADDVRVTHKVFVVLYDLWKGKAPHSASLWGAIVANSYRLPIAPDWDSWLANTEEVYHKAQQDITEALKGEAEAWVAQGQDTLDPWHGMVDWTIKPKTRKLKGYPEWYRKTDGEFSLKSVMGHTLLKLEYLGKPVRWSRSLGYHTEEGAVPHPDGTGENVGYLFSHKFANLFESGALSSRNPQCQRLIELAYSTAYWTAVRERALHVRVQDGWVVPQTGGGTVTGRVTEPLWLTTCDPKAKRIGSELKSRIQAPPGHKLLLADFSSQELRIAWLLGDSRVGAVGGTPMSRAGIAGDKAKGTDSHTMLAVHLTQQAGSKITRDTAKTIGYAIQYGAGVKSVSNTIRLQCPHLSFEESTAIAKAAIEFKKGKVMYEDNERVYYGGSDSDAFNAIASIANTDRPRTPLLEREMPDPLMPRYVGRDYATTRGNWVIQATARDQLDLLCTAFAYLCQHFKLEAFIAWSRHDEVIVVAPDHEVDLAAEMLQQAHAFTWAALHEALGLVQMPTIGLWFDDVNVDIVCRKEVTKSCVTPSNTVEPPKGYIITPAQIKGVKTWVDT